ncbi:MAG: Cation diffusion facilitator family transporter [Microgenomates bacterium 39_7]|nr:MAG: Cation diffusion facilitator family transporter [Microgenomates bacterium 39_7]
MSSISQKNQLKKGAKVAQTAIWLEGLLVAAKIVAGWLTGSLALISDAIHSASDIISIVTSWMGLKLAQKDSNEDFPYGYYKAESIATALISLIILYAGYEMVKRGINTWNNPSELNLPLVALVVSLADAIILFIFGNYEIKIGQETGAQSLIAMGKENRTHIFSSTAVFFGTLSAYLSIPYIESVVTLGISVIIFQIGFSSLKEAVLVLMDVSPEPEIENKIQDLVKQVPGIEEAFDLRLRKAGPSIFGEIKVGIRRSVDVMRSHEIAHKVEKRVKKEFPSVESLLVHVEPYQSDYRHIVIPVKDKNRLSSKIAKDFARAPYFLCINLKEDQIQGFYFLDNPHQDKKIKAGLAAAKTVAETQSDCVIAASMGEIAFHALREYLFDIYQTDAKTAKEALAKFCSNKLPLLESPIITS